MLQCVVPRTQPVVATLGNLIIAEMEGYRQSVMSDDRSRSSNLTDFMSGHHKVGTWQENATAQVGLATEIHKYAQADPQLAVNSMISAHGLLAKALTDDQTKAAIVSEAAADFARHASRLKQTVGGKSPDDAKAAPSVAGGPHA